MEYERIHKVQNGIISPSKLRMKLMGPHHASKKEGSNNSSSRASPSKLDDSEFIKNSLLASGNGEFDEEAAPTVEIPHQCMPPAVLPETNSNDIRPRQSKETTSKENGSLCHGALQQFPNAESCNYYPSRSVEEDGMECDSNASSSNFEFHKERATHFRRSFSRPMPSKWNDAEKWIMSRQNTKTNYFKKHSFLSQMNRVLVTNTSMAASEAGNQDPRRSIHLTNEIMHTGYNQPNLKMTSKKLPSVAADESCHIRAMVDQSSESKDMIEVNQRELYCLKCSEEDKPAAAPAVRPVSMRDIGTAMTPFASQDPSRTTTPADATTPLRSPTSSVPSTPRKKPPPVALADYSTESSNQSHGENMKAELTENELKQKTRKEILALGVQLGKMNIAAWASKEDKEKNAAIGDNSTAEGRERIEFEKRAVAWMEAEKSKQAARFKSEGLKIQTWESKQQAKLEAEMCRIEAVVEQMRSKAEANMVKKIAVARQSAEKKRAAAETKMNREAERMAAQAEYIRQTGRMPSFHNTCCGWLS